METHASLSAAGRDALGYIGGGILAMSLLPQIARLLLTRSARDISILWSLLYLLGSSLSLAYMLLVGAEAGAIPAVFELLACLITIALKLLYDFTSWGRQLQMEKAAELEEQLIAVIEQQFEPTQEEFPADSEQQQEQQQAVDREQGSQQLTKQQDRQASAKQASFKPASFKQASFKQTSFKLRIPVYATDNIDPLYREEPGFSSDGGAATKPQQGHIAPVGAAAAGMPAPGSEPAKCAITYMYENPLAGANSSAGAAGGTADSAAPNPAALTKKSSFRYSFKRRRAASCYGPGSTSGATATPSSTAAAGTATGAVPCILPLALQLQQQQLPWYLQSGISHTTGVPRASVTAGSTSGTMLGSTAAGSAVPGQQCCCHVCGAPQLAAAADASSRSGPHGRRSVFGQRSSLAGGQPAVEGSSHSMPNFVVLTANARQSVFGRGSIFGASAAAGDCSTKASPQPTGAVLSTAAERYMQRSSSVGPRSQLVPERSGGSLTALGASAWQAVRRRSIALLSVSGMGKGGSSTNSSNNGSTSGPTVAAAAVAGDGVASSSRQCDPSWAGHTAAALKAAAAAAAADADSGAVPGAWHAVPRAHSSRAQPKLSVIHSTPSTPRASAVMKPEQNALWKAALEGGSAELMLAAQQQEPQATAAAQEAATP